MIPHVRRLSELDPRRRRLHVVGEVHPGELAARGYRLEGGEWLLDLRAPEDPKHDVDALAREFEVLAGLGYAFFEGDEWSPAELFRKYRDGGRIAGRPRFIR